MKINWIVRLKNKTFWITIIPIALVLIKNVLSLFGIDFDTIGLNDPLIAIVSAIFSILGMLGIIVDPTTKGLSDSNQAMTYDSPREDACE